MNIGKNKTNKSFILELIKEKYKKDVIKTYSNSTWNLNVKI
jgi:hypothetical protein